MAFLVCLPPVAAETERSGDPQVTESSSVIAVVRAPAPRELVQKVMAIARQVQPGLQTEALPYMLGGMLGDVTLQGVSESENVGLLLVAHDGEISPVLLLRLTDKSPLRESLPNLSMSLDDFEGWTFVRPEGVSSSVIAGQERALLSAVRAKRRYDVELAADGPALAQKMRSLFEAAPGAGMAEWLLVKPVFEALVAEADELRDFRLGLDLSQNRIDQVYYLRAAEHSALAAFLDQKRPADLDFARLIPADGAIAFLGGFDVPATSRYFDHVMGQLRQEADDGSRPAWQRLGNLAARYLRSTNGASGGVMSLDGLQLQMASIAPTSMTDEELLEMLAQTVEVMDEMIQFDPQEEEVQPKQRLLPNEFTVNETRVHVVRSETPGALGMPDGRQDMHYAIVEGHLLNATDLGRLAGLIQAIQGGEAVENNLAEQIAIADDVLFEAHIDLVRYFGGVMAAFVPEEMAMKLRELQERGLEPVSVTLSARGGEGEMKVSLPVKTLSAAYQAFMAFMAGQQRPFQIQP